MKLNTLFFALIMLFLSSCGGELKQEPTKQPQKKSEPGAEPVATEVQPVEAKSAAALQ